MLLPIYTYGQPVLRKVAEDIPANTPEVQQLISDMWETLYKCGSGIGLAAPQVGESVRLFVIDLTIMEDDEHPEYKTFKRVFVNPHLVEEFGEEVTMEEGCLSIPGIGENVKRMSKVRMKYLDENFEEHEDVFEDFIARVVMHEYDHLEGHVFTDRVSVIRRQLIKSKLESIAKGKVRCGYKIKKVEKR
ncbi:MAG: peptide deformylase [Paludibacteraceae bacterium]|nr:peptide deformylase [Paludibacteraceae bacterium]MBQ5778796.1 peptide deformylase [Paludibacteraceae bacterium]